MGVSNFRWKGSGSEPDDVLRDEGQGVQAFGRHDVVSERHLGRVLIQSATYAADPDFQRELERSPRHTRWVRSRCSSGRASRGRMRLASGEPSRSDGCQNLRVGLPVVRARWRGAAARETAREAVLRLVTGGDLTGLGLGRVRGRIDLRGLWLASLRGIPRDPGQPDHAVASDVVWQDVDLSSGTVPIDLVRCSLSNVCLDRAQWTWWRAGQRALDDCTFDRTRIGRDASWGRATFEDCRFVATDLPNPFWIRGANLIRCRFEGTSERSASAGRVRSANSRRSCRTSM